MLKLTFSKTLVEGLKQELAKAYQLNNLQLHQKVRGLLWISEGKSLVEVARLLQVSVKTVYNWLQQLMVKGLRWLQGQFYRGRGRKSKLSAEQKRALYNMIVAGPQAQGFRCGIWNTAMIAELIWRRFGVRYNPRYLSSLLKKLGLSYQKARFITDHQDEEDYERVRQEWVEQKWPAILAQAKATGAVILFDDEVSFALWGSLSRTWAPRGKQPLVKTRGLRKGLKMFGAIDFHSGAFYYREALAYALSAKAFKQLKAEGVPAEILAQLSPLKGHHYASQSLFIQALHQAIGAKRTVQYQDLLLNAAEGVGKFNSDSYIEFLTQLLDQIAKPIILIQDGAPYHRSKVVKQFEADHSRLSIHPLPAFSPDFNPIERLWKNTKKEATHLKYFKTFAELRASVLEVFQQYLHDAAQVIRVMKKLRAQAALALSAQPRAAVKLFF